MHPVARLQGFYKMGQAERLSCWSGCRHWSYDLKDVSIDRVETSRDGKRALVEATLTEAGSLLASDGAVIDVYQAAFTQEYEMRLIRNKGWRLVASKLIF